MTTEERYAHPNAFAPGRVLREHAEPIKVGSMLWVFTDPHRGHEFAYNRWYERDHYYAGCMIGANNFAGSRWVATRRHKDARFPDHPDMPFARDAGSYACVYYMLDGAHESWLEWSTPQALELYELDRGFNSRTHYNTGTYRYEWRAYRDRDPVLLEMAPDYRYPGMVAMWVEAAEGVEQARIDDWFDGNLSAWIADTPVANVSSWSYIPLLPTKAEFVPDDPEGARRTFLLQFVEGDPLDSWEQQHRLADALAASGLAQIVFAAPFIATKIGTDAYIDELW